MERKQACLPEAGCPYQNPKELGSIMPPSSSPSIWKMLKRVSQAYPIDGITPSCCNRAQTKR